MDADAIPAARIGRCRRCTPRTDANSPPIWPRPRVIAAAPSSCATRTRCTAATGSTTSSARCTARSAGRVPHDPLRLPRRPRQGCRRAPRCRRGDRRRRDRRRAAVRGGLLVRRARCTATTDERASGIVAIAPPLSEASEPPAVRTLVLSPSHDQFCPADRAEPIVASWSQHRLRRDRVRRSLPQRPHRAWSPSAPSRGSPLDDVRGSTERTHA